MEYSGVRYVIRIGIARGQWQVAIYLGEQGVAERVDICREIAANRIIDAWMKKQFRGNLL
jgi:hypothetical protein